MRKDKRRITGAFLGTIVEYYDYSLYGFSADILASKFFPEMNKLDSLMYIFGIYAIAYISKPLGSIIFSYIGDLYGRLVALKITIIGIALPTFAIGMLPDFHTIGVFSVYVLLICRFTQGFFVAGEYDGAAIYVIEHLGKKYHYTASSITRAMGVSGLLLGIGMTNFFNSSIFPDWGWRVPFVLSLPLAMLTLHYRKYLSETPDFAQANDQKTEFVKTYKFVHNNVVPLFLVILFAGGFGATYQLSIIFMKQYLPLVAPVTVKIITSFSILIVFIFGISMPVAGFLADRFGKVIVIKCSLILTIIACWIFAISIQHQLINLMLIASIFLAVSTAPFNALAHGIMIKAFKTKERYRGVSLGHTIGSMLMSGTASYVCLYFMSSYKIILFPLIYISLFAVISYLTTYFLNNQYNN